jgi:hypothetical protein
MHRKRRLPTKSPNQKDAGSRHTQRARNRDCAQQQGAVAHANSAFSANARHERTVFRGTLADAASTRTDAAQACFGTSTVRFRTALARLARQHGWSAALDPHKPHARRLTLSGHSATTKRSRPLHQQHHFILQSVPRPRSAARSEQRPRDDASGPVHAHVQHVIRHCWHNVWYVYGQ